MSTGPGELPPVLSEGLDLASGLAPETDNPALRALIAREIAASGPMTFRRFMELALYHPTEGYYMGERVALGRDGDYVTSPLVSPLFGYAVARQLSELWRALGEPSEFHLIEHGPGTGALARDILRWIAAREPAFYRALRYRGLERSPVLRRRMAESLIAEFPAGAIDVLAAELPTAHETSIGCVLANELIDSFPVHRVVIREGCLRELYVGIEGGRFVDVETDPSTAALSNYFERLGVWPGEANVAEVNLAASLWMAETASRVERGYVLILDYGYPAERLFAPWRRAGTLLCFHHQQALEDPYRFLGRQDMTAHVDFTTVQRAGEASGMRLVARTDQRRFLLSLGLDAAMGAPAEGVDLAGYFARRRAAEALTDPAGLGRVGVLLFGKDAPEQPFSGFGSPPASRESTHAGA